MGVPEFSGSTVEDDATMHSDHSMHASNDYHNNGNSESHANHLGHNADKMTDHLSHSNHKAHYCKVSKGPCKHGDKCPSKHGHKDDSVSIGSACHSSDGFAVIAIVSKSVIPSFKESLFKYSSYTLIDQLESPLYINHIVDTPHRPPTFS